MKKIYLLTGLVLFSTFLKLKAQNLWEALPLTFDYAPSVMYYDSAEERSYISGWFTKVNDSLCNIVRYDGVNFTLMPSSPLYATGCMANYHGTLYVGGYGLAKWDGNSWISIDTTAIVSDLYIYNDKLYITGGFESIAGQPIGKVAIWNDTSWTDLYKIDTLSSNTFLTGNTINYKGRFYVSGNINKPTSDTTISEITMFDGEKWTSVGGQIHGDLLSGVNKLYIWKDTLYVGGQFAEASGAAGNSIAKWDGSQWHRLNNGLLQNSQAAVTDMIAYGDELFVSGWFYIVDGRHLGAGHKGFAKWDGSHWCTMNTSGDGTLLRFGTWKDQLFLMGGFHHLNGQPMEFMAKWVGGDYTDSCSSGGVGIDESIDGNNPIAIQLYPNPASAELMVQFEKLETGKTTIAIDDVLGRSVLVKNYPRRNPGLQNLKLDVSELKPGIYWLTVHADEKQYSRKLVVHR